MTPVKKRLLLVLLALALGGGACSSPQAKVALKRAHLLPDRVYYVSAEQFKTADFAPPPAPGSEAQQADLAAILDWQAKRSKADCRKAKKTAKADYDFFWKEKPLFPEPLPVEVKEFFERLALDLDGAVTNMKKRWERPRPFRAYPGQAEPCIKKSSGFSYPSGHSSYSRVFANVLSDIAPERRADFIAKADEIAQDRVIGGVHFPTDIAAGKRFGDLYHSELLKSEAYRQDIEKMKALLPK
ncbi:MAG: phosphatase PAP2 family protein [Elusimicrobiales bacterium]|nr:phosphatase PAP2 family protein [Elusimicrobiales bacterium]